MKNFLQVFALALAVSAVFTASVVGRGPMFLDRPLDAWLADLSDSSPEVRRGAAFALGKIGAEDGDPAGAVEALTHSLGDKDSTVRDFAASGLGELLTGLKDLNQPYWAKTGVSLQKTLKEDQDPRVRRSAAFALGAFGPEAASARDDLIAACEDPSSSVRQNAAWALGKLGKAAGADGVERLRTLLTDDEPLVRRDALHALGEIGKTAAHPAVATMLKTAGTEKAGVVRKAAVEALFDLVGPEDRKSAHELYPLLTDKDSETRLHAAFVLASIGGSEAVAALPVLRAALKNDDPNLQELAAAKIGDIGPDAAPAVEDLGRALVTAKELKVRLNAAVSLSHIGPPAQKALPQLVQALQYAESGPDSQYNGIRPFVAEALDCLDYPAVAEAIPALLKTAAADPDTGVRLRSVWALCKAPDLDKYKITPVFTALLDETEGTTSAVRDEAAYALAFHLRDKAPDKTIDVLLDMLTDPKLILFNGNQTKVSGVGAEGNTGKSEVKENVGSDARFIGAEALGWMGRKANRPDVIKALQKAAQDDDRRLSSTAKDALLAIKRTMAP